MKLQDSDVTGIHVVFKRGIRPMRLMMLYHVTYVLCAVLRDVEVVSY
jgi:hypothetical protein